MKAIFVGSGAFGIPTLKRLVSNSNCDCVVTAEDKPAGRNRSLQPTPIGAWAEEHDLQILKTEDINSDSILEQLSALQFDVMVVIAFGQKLSQTLLQQYQAINLHASLLPRWRGAAPIHAAIMNGDEETGISVITLANAMDAGMVLGSVSTQIGSQETTGQLHDRLAELGPDLVEEVLSSTFDGQEQVEAHVTYASKIRREDAQLDLHLNADEVARKIRGLSPWPSCHLYVNGVDCKILNAIATDGEGEIGEILSNGTIAVGTGAIEILELKPAGSGSMGWKDFCNGRSIQVGDRCEATA